MHQCHLQVLTCNSPLPTILREHCLLQREMFLKVQAFWHKPSQRKQGPSGVYQERVFLFRVYFKPSEKSGYQEERIMATHLDSAQVSKCQSNFCPEFHPLDLNT